jgi:poly [ADP-ribose] polymerase 10/14/15
MYQEFVDAFKSIGESSGGIISYLYSGITGIKAGLGSLLGVDDHEYEQSSENEEQINDDFRQVHSTGMSLDSEIFFCIYGETDNFVQTASKRLRKTIEEQFISEEITDINISSITDSTVKEFKALASTHIVEIDVDRDPALHYIKLFGSVQNVLLVKDKIRDKMSTFNCEQAIKSAADVLYKTVNWIRQTSNEEEEGYGEDLNYEIEQHYRNKQPTFHCKEEEFIINFEKMEEMDIKTGKNAKVRRVDLSKESKPDNWDPMPIDSKGNEKQVHCVSLTAGCPEYNHVEIHFNKTMQKGTSYNQIISIKRIQNPALYQQYVVKRKQMDKLNPKGHENERWLWHGTKFDALEHINTSGLDRGYAGVNGTAFGRGVYFALDASYSNGYAGADANGHRHMYYCQVLTGEYTVGNGSMIVPPAKNPQIDKSVCFDSTVNNQANPTIFVVYRDCQCYQTYLISYN